MIDVDMRLEMRGKRIERTFNLRVVAVMRRHPSKPLDPRAPLGVISEEAMHISSGHATVR
jgi:hypothetical protein